MSPENSTLTTKMLEFIALEPTQGVNRFKLEGAKGLQAKINTIVSLFENPVIPHSYTVFTYNEPPCRLSENACLTRILQISVPEQLQTYQSDEKTIKFYEAYCRKHNLPYASLLFGFELNQQNQVTTDPFVQLCSVRGMPPNETMRVFQTVAKDRLAKHN